MTPRRNCAIARAFALTSLLTLSAALANPPPIAIGGHAPTVPKRISRLVDINLQSLTLRTNTERMAWASSTIVNTEKQSVGVNLRVTIDTLDGKPTTTINQRHSVPATTVAVIEVFLPVFACAKITVNVTPSSNYTRDLDPLNNEKTATLPCVK
jgi:hypothetical protein